MKKLIGALLFVLVSAGQGLALQPLPGQVTLTILHPASDGTVSFSLMADDSSQLSVEVPVFVGDSGYTIASKIRAIVNSGDWSATTDSSRGSTLMFFHAGVPVGEIDCVVGTASASTTLSADAVKLSALLQIDANAVASGFDPKGRASYLTFSVSGAAPYTVTLHPGQTARSIMDGIASYFALNSLVSRISPHEVLMDGPGPVEVFLQTNDTGLQGALALSETQRSDNRGFKGGFIGRGR